MSQLLIDAPSGLILLDLIISFCINGTRLPDSKCNTRLVLLEIAAVAFAASDTHKSPLVERI
jgi:hypothetical protein